jgi:hypothetical protein
MKMIAEYLEHALQFEQMASEAKDQRLKADLLAQADAYRKLAEKRVSKMNMPMPHRPENSIRQGHQNSN